uniref:Uncharacterized protein n=1 Tax=Arion vulgaris TaxID=1028688 RepID=A0A0B7A4N2_9EUPU
MCCVQRGNFAVNHSTQEQFFKTILEGMETNNFSGNNKVDQLHCLKNRHNRDMFRHG